MDRIIISMDIIRSELKKMKIASPDTVGCSGHIYIESLHIRAYIRMSQRYNVAMNKPIPALEIGAIEVDHQFRQEGNCSKFLDYFEGIALEQGRTVYVENVHNSVLRDILEKRGYSQLPNGSRIPDNNYWM